jgi:hypothetical protein
LFISKKSSSAGTCQIMKLVKQNCQPAEANWQPSSSVDNVGHSQERRSKLMRTAEQLSLLVFVIVLELDPPIPLFFVATGKGKRGGLSTKAMADGGHVARSKTRTLRSKKRGNGANF